MTEMQLRLRVENSVCDEDSDEDFCDDIYFYEIPTDQCNFESIAYKELFNYPSAKANRIANSNTTKQS